ncbi:LysR family transcriptional regulator [Candidatus Thorarchaeota archaeon]|nr:MAG: LysR family transcriptional regulator [Candidatus Thorarchaeota archaeon]
MTSKEQDSLNLEPSFKLWLEREGDYIFGKGAYRILQAIHDAGTITEGAKKLGMSYRYAWGVVRKIEKKLGVKVVETHKGGSSGGGGARVTEHGLELMNTYARVTKAFEEALDAI